jgi:hypothetical protein
MELPLGRTVNPNSVEHMHVRSIALRERWDRSRIEQGIRAARAREPKLMFVLEQATEVLDGMVESQMGSTMRSSGTEFAHRVPPTEMQIWREAYRTADEGQAMDQFGAVYAAAGEFAGVVF